VIAMKKDIHPKLYKAVIYCSCGAKYETISTKPELHVDICSKCHPFFTGEQRFVDAGGRAERFARKYGRGKEG